MAGQRPKQGWIYFLNPYRVSLRCGLGHTYLYDLTEPTEIECQHPNCSCKINSSRVFRGEHPYLVWTSEQFQDDNNYVQTFVVIPLTSSERDTGLPTTYPLNPSSTNGLDKKSYLLIHQIITVDGNCFKERDGNWLTRIGTIKKEDKLAIEERLKYFLGIQDNLDDWLIKNASVSLLEKVFGYLSQDQQSIAIERLIDNIDEP